jgi:hypothetical protein
MAVTVPAALPTVTGLLLARAGQDQAAAVDAGIRGVR